MFYKGIKLRDITTSDVIMIYCIAKEVETSELDKKKPYQAGFWHYINMNKIIYKILVDTKTLPFYYIFIPWLIKLRQLKPIMEKLSIYKEGVQLDENPEEKLKKTVYILATKLKQTTKAIKEEISLKDLNELLVNIILEEINQDLRAIQIAHNAAKYVETLEDNRNEYQSISENKNYIPYDEKADYELNKTLVGEADNFYLNN